MTKIRGIGRRFAILICKKAGIDPNKRAGELSEEETETLKTVMSEPRNFDIPEWFLNRQKDIIDGTTSHLIANQVDSKLREDLERMKKMRLHRGLRHAWGIRVRGQHTCSTGRHGRTMGVVSKK